MDVVGSEIGQKMRSAIKAKLTELGCYVDDELPDYVMVMVANKRTRAQMEDDLQLFLGDNTVQFVNWLHQVLRKLQEVTVTAPIVAKHIDGQDKNKDRSSSKDRKLKLKKEKVKDKHKKGDGSKKSKKRSKDKDLKKKEDKKLHKKKKKSRDHDHGIIRPNIPPLLMNMEKDAEPSITDVFAGQILKNHGFILETLKEDAKEEAKPEAQEVKRPVRPIIDPATISTQPDDVSQSLSQSSEGSGISHENEENVTDSTSQDNEENLANTSKTEELKDLEAKMQGLKRKLAEPVDSMSEDEDFLNIRTETEELNDFGEEVSQDTSKKASVLPLQKVDVENDPQIFPSHSETVTQMKTPTEVETLPQIELKLPKRPVRERLGAREEPKDKKSSDPEIVAENITVTETSNERIQSPERYTPPPDRENEGKSAKSRLGEKLEVQKKIASSASSDKSESVKKLSSKVSSVEGRPASVVRVRPRPRTAPASNLLLRAVADAHKSLLNAPPKKDHEQQQVKRALVLPMRRAVDPQKIVIQIHQDRPPSRENSECEIDIDTESLADLESDDNKSFKESVTVTNKNAEFNPKSITKKIVNTYYVPPRQGESKVVPSGERQVDENLVIETIVNRNTDQSKEKGPTFVVTLDGLDPNMFLAKKLKTEGLIEDATEITKEMKGPKEIKVPKGTKPLIERAKPKITTEVAPTNLGNKRLSDTSEDSDTQVIIKSSENKTAEKKDSLEVPSLKEQASVPKKRKASPIVFDVLKTVKEKRERTESSSSDNHVTITTTASAHKFDSVPPLATQTERTPCLLFPACRYGAACRYTHPMCRFGVACTRRACVYSHPPRHELSPALASHVVPATNFKAIQTSSIPNMCKYFPNCVNPACHFYHPKPCRYGKACVNKLECNFYHYDLSTPLKWRPA